MKYMAQNKRGAGIIKTIAACDSMIPSLGRAVRRPEDQGLVILFKTARASPSGQVGADWRSVGYVGPIRGTVLYLHCQ